MLSPKIAKYLALSGLAGYALSYSAHTYVAMEDIAVSHLTATIAGVQSDLATAWGYAPASPPHADPVDPDSLPVRALIDAASLKYGINPALARAVASVESRLNPSAESPMGAIGIMQVMPSNAQKRCGIQPHKLWRESINVDCGVKILREELATYKNDVIKALKSYNGGTNCVRNRCDESERYVVKVLATLGSEIPATVN